MTFNKVAWQREQRREFKARHGYSSTANYATGQQRAAVLDRDGHQCVQCGMSEGEHLQRWGRPITIDHKDKNRANNKLENLQTLCLPCHGRKDLIPQLRQQLVPIYKPAILRLRREGWTYERIADFLELSIGSVYTWHQRWIKEPA